MQIKFQLLLVVCVECRERLDTIELIGRSRPGVTPETHPKLNAMVGYAINYYRDFVAPTKKFREPTEPQRCRICAMRWRT